MERSQYIVDRRLYSDEVVARAAHRYTGRLVVEIQMEADALLVIFSDDSGAPLPSDLRSRFARDLLDERLRAAVRLETQGLQQELIRAALVEAQPSVGSDVQV